MSTTARRDPGRTCPEEVESQRPRTSAPAKFKTPPPTPASVGSGWVAALVIVAFAAIGAIVAIVGADVFYPEKLESHVAYFAIGTVGSITGGVIAAVRYLAKLIISIRDRDRDEDED